MNLSKLFEMQKVLDDHILEEHPELKGQDNLDWKILALQVELGECANEWRGFKKWSKDQEPRMKRYSFEDEFHPNENPLLEEYVDCLHFILSIGIERSYENINPASMKKINVTKQLIYLFDSISQFYFTPSLRFYTRVCNLYIGLGEMLGFDWEQIEESYYMKNQINHERQNSGY